MTRVLLRWAGRSISGFAGGVAVAIVIVGVASFADARDVRAGARRQALADARRQAAQR